MNVTAPSRTISAARKVEHFDVLIVGAGISGVGSAYHLTKQLPETTFVVLEEQESYGGTWWTHKYPGIRSDSDLHTLATASSHGPARRSRPPRKSAPIWAR